MTKFIRKAIKLANAAIDLPTGNQKHFSFIIIRNKIVGFGYNRGFKTHPLAAKFGHKFNGIHSELSAITNCTIPPTFFPYCTFLNIRIMKNRLIGLSRPCKNCEQMLTKFGFRDIIYSIDEGGFSYLSLSH